MTKDKKPALIIGTAGIVGLLVFIFLVPSYTTFYSVDSSLNRSQAKQISRSIAAKIGVDLPPNLIQNTTFGMDQIALTYLERKVGTERANALVRSDSVPINSWKVIWFDRSKQSDVGEKLQVQVSQKGQLLSFKHWLPDSMRGVFLQEAAANDTLTKYWDKHDLTALTGTHFSDWYIKTSEPIRLENRQDWSFVFVRNEGNPFGLDEQVSIRISGGQIISYAKSFNAPTEFAVSFNSRSTPYVFMTAFSWVLIFILFAAGLVIFLRRYNEGEAGIGSSMLVSGTYYIAAAVSIILSFPSFPKTAQIATMNLFYVGIIIAGMLLLLWTPLLGILTFSSWGIGESSARAQWPEKLFTFDAASHFKIFNEKVGASVLRGFAFAGIFLGIYAITHPIFSLTAVVVDSSTPLDSYLPSVEALADSFAVALFCETVYRFGVLSFFGKKRILTGAIVSALLFVPSLFYSLPYGEYQMFPRIIIALATSAAMIFLFLRYDFLTVFITSMVFNSAHSFIPIFGSSNSFFELNAMVIVLFLAVPIVVGFVALWKKQHFELTVDLMPRHIRMISERERMARELEIAKNVQNNLLPKTSPSIPHFEFGGICIPALEVGGDYYDFVRMNDGVIGITIADVSGKGLPAAIYMTLTKGALQAYGEDEPSPRKVLSRINSIVYRSVSRGIFISMIYAVIDTTTRKVRFARAGHNPLVYFSTGNKDAKLFTPNGLALGLDNGERFDSTLEEMEITLKPGDTLVFYTDGFSEAMDAKSREFGEDRLVELIESTRHLPVKEMLEKIESKVRDFVGNAPQHDDMTMVAVKVKAE